MNEIRYRAIITWTPAETVGEVMEAIDFTLADLVAIDPPFSIRELVIPWLRVGNLPFQSTGLHDSTSWWQLSKEEQAAWLAKGYKKSEWKGREIWEGSIIEAMDKDYHPEECGPWVVVFHDGAFFGETRDGDRETWLPYWTQKEVTVIGNTTEHPDLMKEVEK